MKVYKLTNLSDEYINKINILIGKHSCFSVEDIKSVCILCENNLSVFIINYIHIYGVVKPSSKYLLELILNSKEMARAEYRQPLCSDSRKIFKHHFLSSNHSMDYLKSIIKHITWFSYTEKKLISL